MRNFAQDVIYAVRTLRRSPGFLGVVIISIAIGIAANTTIFSFANAVLFGSLPVGEPDRLLNFANDQHGSSFSFPNYSDLRQSDAFADVAAHFPLAPASFEFGGTPERIWGQLVTGNYFSTVRVPIALGRGISDRDDREHAPVVVLHYAFWKRRFAGDPSILGKTVMLNNRAWQVVGVAGTGFRGTDRMIVMDFSAPLSFYGDFVPEIGRHQPLDKRDEQWLFLDGRLNPGVSLTQAFAAVNVINARLDAEFHKNQPQSKILLEQSGKLWGDAMRPAVGLAAGLMMVVALVLLIACANVANLLLARAASRQREIAVRLAVGAGRGRLVRQLLTESILLSLAGAAAGFLLSFWATSAVSRLDLPIPIPIELHLAPDFRVLAFTMALSLASAVLFGLAPALRATRPDLISAVKNGEMQISGFRRFGLRNALVVTQVTLSLVLLMCAGLFLRSLGRASSIDLGIEAGPVLSVAFDPNQHSASPEQRRQFLRDVKQRVAALPGIASVSYVSFLPLTVVGEQDLFVAGSAPAIHANVERVDPGYFATIGIPLLAGRDFTADSFKTTTVIVNRAFADRLFPGQNPLGQQFGGDLHQHEIVGVVANSKQRTLGEGDRPAVYLPLGDNLMSLSGVALVAKAASPAAMIEPVRRQIQSLDPNLAVFNALTMKDQTEKAMLLPRLTAALFTIFGISGLALAIVGLYGVMSFSVSRRTREIGIRMALGAERITILAMIAWQGLGLTAVGLLAGIAISLAASRFAETLLCGVSPRDLETFLAVPLLLGASDWWHP